MRRPILGTLISLAACLILVPASASALPKIGGHDNGYSICEEQALHLYVQGMHNGLDFGRNRVEDGKLLSSGRVIPEPHPCEWRNYLDRQLHPPEPVAPSAPGQIAPTPASVSVAPTTGGACGGITPYEGAGQCWAIPYAIVSCESGGNYSAYNESGASGAYQLMEGGQGTPAEQDAAASAMWNGGAGQSNWDPSDPCSGY